MRLLLLPLFTGGLGVLLLGTGCAAPQQVVDDRASAIDSLQLVIFEMQDSLQLFSDIDSGQYDRDMRALRDRINRLEYDVAVCRDGGRVVSTLLADDLFQPGGTATLAEQGRARLDELADVLRERYPGRTFRVEGHSDNVPLGGSLKERFGSNWELSAARAAAVVRYLIEARDVAPDRLEVVAFGDTRPVASNTSADGRRQNRRVRITVLPESNGL